MDSTTTLSGSSTSINLSSGYRKFTIFVVNYQLTASATGSFGFNNDGATNYRFSGTYRQDNTNDFMGSSGESAWYFGLGGTTKNGNNDNNAVIEIFNPDSTTMQKIVLVQDKSLSGADQKRYTVYSGIWTSTSAVTSIQLKAGNSTWSGGTALVYGEK